MNSSEKKHDAMLPQTLFGDLPLLKLRFHMQVADDARLAEYTGSAWRGIMGQEMQRLVCPFDRRPDCTTCAIREHCPYFVLIEKKTSLPGLSESPRGYVIYSPIVDQEIKRQVDITLIGDCARFLPVVVKAMFKGQKSGIGGKRHPYQITAIDEILPDSSFHSMPLDPDGHLSAAGPHPLKDWLQDVTEIPDKLTIRVQTPLRMRRQGRYLQKMDWQFYFGMLFKRLEGLTRLFHDGELMGKQGWQDFQDNFKVNGNHEDCLAWRDFSRYSNRQKKKLPLGGLMGEVEVVAPDFMTVSWWRAAELLHAGKNVSLGLGKVEII